jgi:hypothetical protein
VDSDSEDDGGADSKIEKTREICEKLEKLDFDDEEGI